MASRLRNVRQRLRKAWIPIQVEYQGNYSTERLRQLGNYMEGLNTRRTLLVCVLTPAPCLVLSLLKEVPPLAPTEAGVYQNGVFLVRAWFIMCFMGVSALVQMGHGAPRLKLTKLQITWVSVLAATVSTLFLFGLCALTVFPLPFGLLVAGPPFVLVIATCFTYISRPQWQVDPSIFVDVQRQLVVYNCQTTLPFVYPLYILGFVSFAGWNQVVFVAVLPIIQIFAKNWISRALGDDNDQKPQCVIFVVEVYNALYVSNVLQTASSWTSTAAIMAVDLLQFWISMIDIVKLLADMNLLMSKIPRGHPMAEENFVQIAVRLMNIETQPPGQKGMNLTLDTNAEDREEVTTREASYVAPQKKDKHPAKASSQKWFILQRSRVSPLHPPIQQESPVLGLEFVFSQAERAQFIQKSAHVLFITEYLVLVEYVEVVLPFVYCLHQWILFQMHNSVYYPALAGVSREQFTSRMLSTLLYSVFELGSFVMLIVVLKRKLGYSCLQQLAFVLDVQAGVVQTKLNLIFTCFEDLTEICSLLFYIWLASPTIKGQISASSSRG